MFDALIFVVPVCFSDLLYDCIVCLDVQSETKCNITSCWPFCSILSCYRSESNPLTSQHFQMSYGIELILKVLEAGDFPWCIITWGGHVDGKSCLWNEICKLHSVHALVSKDAPTELSKLTSNLVSQFELSDHLRIRSSHKYTGVARVLICNDLLMQMFFFFFPSFSPCLHLWELERTAF